MSRRAPSGFTVGQRAEERPAFVRERYSARLSGFGLSNPTGSCKPHYSSLRTVSVSIDAGLYDVSRKALFLAEREGFEPGGDIRPVNNLLNLQ